ncbi:restriction endonuclease subunit S [Chryseobacterium lactis]|uniref:restriction endonuclease subunit S n=1 Tax=Chryseobacterium lactis TaxID=1241981 RepID=UPI001628F0F3|nr:restriction endonuclease subunit S [Chryseobacterium lactis]
MRFPEFTEEWETKKLGEVATNKSEKYNPANETDFIKCIEMEHLITDTGQLLGYIDGSTSGSIKNVFNEGDVLFGKLRPYLKKYLQAPFDGVCSSEIWVLKGKNISNDFLYRIVQTKLFIDLANQSSGSKMPRADWNVVESGSFSIPTPLEQKKISSFLALLDERIQTQNKIIEELKLLKITISKKLFSRQLRFKNGNNENYIDWNTKKLGEVTTLVNKRNKNNEKLPVYSINNKLGFVPQSEQFEGVDSEDRGYDIKLYKIIDKNTFAYNPARINVGSIGYSKNLENIIISSLYVCFKTDNTINDNFLYQYLKTDFFNREVLRNVEGGVRDYLFYDNFARIKFGLPCIEEQKKIADYISSIDSKIDVESQLLHKFEKQKRYLLANLFI